MLTLNIGAEDVRDVVRSKSQIPENVLLGSYLNWGGGGWLSQSSVPEHSTSTNRYYGTIGLDLCACHSLLLAHRSLLLCHFLLSCGLC